LNGVPPRATIRLPAEKGPAGRAAPAFLKLRRLAPGQRRGPAPPVAGAKLMFQMVRVWARFVRKADGQPLTGKQYRAVLYDQDPLIDDKMGEARLDEQGRAEFTCELADAASLDSPMETLPDLYVVLYDGDREVFRCPVFKDVDFLAKDPVTGERNQLTQDLGTFAV
jgi:hypothetical protein